MQQAAQRSGVQIITGDTKVVDKGKGDGLFINTAGVGVPELACEGRFAAFVPAEQAVRALDIPQKCEGGAGDCRIGSVIQQGEPRVSQKLDWSSAYPGYV